MMQRFLSVLYNIIIHIYIYQIFVYMDRKKENMENLFVDIDKLLKCLNV